KFLDFKRAERKFSACLDFCGAGRQTDRSQSPLILGANALGDSRNSVAVLAIDAGMSFFTGLNSLVLCQMLPCSPRNGQQEILFVDELITGIIGRGMHPGIHADRVAGARFHAEPAEDATKLVDDEPLGVFLVSLALCIPLVVSRFDVNAL